MKILYIDMDNVIVDFQSGIDKLSDKEQVKYEDRLDDVPGIFSLMVPMKNAIESVEKLSKIFDALIFCIL